MSEPVQLAKAAREHLASALRALQSDATVPAALMDLAEPIAEAMGVLHRVERSNGTELEGRATALADVRSVLDRLQGLGFEHPAIEIVMEAIAQSLSNVHALVKLDANPPAIQAAPVVATPAAPFNSSSTVRMDVPPRPSPVAAQPVASQQQQVFAVPQQAAPQRQVFAVTPAIAAQQVFAAPQPVAVQQPAYAAPPPAAPVASPSSVLESPQGGAGRVDVELGAHSDSNFYKGLGGNDVVEHGGIFVATYLIPKMGASVALRLLLPGDYEFQANGIVQWVRPAGGSAAPGFGARFTHITPEGRQLVHRYTRNREPIFYDDL